jgi:UDPglucose 6-dehydrogenase
MAALNKALEAGWRSVEAGRFRPARDVITDLRTEEMIKYASNAFLATKISFINEIANICEAFGADVKEVAAGMGYDKRIGATRCRLGYGGSCFLRM